MGNKRILTNQLNKQNKGSQLHLLTDGTGKAQFKRRISHVPNLIAILGPVQTSISHVPNLIAILVDLNS